MPGSDLIQSVARAFDLLGVLAAHPDGVALADLAEATGLRTTTTHNLVKTLVAKGFASRSGQGCYRLGAGALGLAASFHAGALWQGAEVAIRELAGWVPAATVTCATVVDGTIPVVLRMSPDLPGLVQRPVGVTFKPYINASGLAVLAFGDAEQVAAVRQAHPFSVGGAAIWGSPDDLEDYLDRSRQAGVVVAPNAANEPFRAAVPIAGGAGLAALMGLSLPPGERQTDALDLLRQAAALSQEERTR